MWQWAPPYLTFAPGLLLGLLLAAWPEGVRRPTARTWAWATVVTQTGFLLAAVVLLSQGRRVDASLGHWLQVGALEFPLRFRLDGLAAAFSVPVALGLIVAVGLVERRRKHWPGEAWIRHLGFVLAAGSAAQAFLVARNLATGFLFWIVSGHLTLLAVATVPDGSSWRQARAAWFPLAAGDLLLLLGLGVLLAFAANTDLDTLHLSGYALSDPRVRWLFGLRPVFWAALLLGLAGLARVGGLPFQGWVARTSRCGPQLLVLVAGVVAPTGAYLFFRVAGATSFSPVGLAVVGAVALAGAFLLAAGSAQSADFFESLAYLTSAVLSGALGTACFGGFRPAGFQVLVAGAATAALAPAAEAYWVRSAGESELTELSRRGRLWPADAALALGLGALAGLMPGSWGARLAGLEALFTRVFPPTPGLMRFRPDVAVIWNWLTAALFLGATFALAAAALRLWLEVAVGRGPSQDGAERTGRAPAVAGLVLGVAVSMGVGLLGSDWGAPLLERSLRVLGSWEGRWVVREGARQLGTGDLVHVLPALHSKLLLAQGLVAGCGALWLAVLFVRRWRRGRTGHLFGWRPWLVARTLLGVDAATTAVGTLGRWAVVGLGWVERSLGERLLADWILVRLPAGVVAASGWMASRMLRWRRLGAVALALAGLAWLLAVFGPTGGGSGGQPARAGKADAASRPAPSRRAGGGEEVP